MGTVLILLAVALLGVGVGVGLGYRWARPPRPKGISLKDLKDKDAQVAHMVWLDRKASLLIFDLCSRALLIKPSDAQKWQVFLVEIFERMARLYGRKDAWDFSTKELLHVANEIQVHLAKLGLYRVSLSSVKRALIYWRRSQPIMLTGRAFNLAQSLYSLSPQGLVFSLSVELARQGTNRIGQTLIAGLTAKRLYSETRRHLEKVRTLESQMETEFLRTSLRDLQGLLYNGKLVLSDEELLRLSSVLESLVLASRITDLLKVQLLQNLKAETHFFLKKGRRRYRLSTVLSRWMGRRLSPEEGRELLARIDALVPPESWVVEGPARFRDLLSSRFGGK